MKTLARQRDATEILERLGRLQHDAVRRWGRMSAHQMVCHLSDANRMATGERPALPVKSPLPRPVMRFVARYVPMRWPEGVPTVPECDQTIGGTKPVHFERDVAEVAEQIRGIASGASRLLPDHPIFGPLTKRQWLRWAYLHTDHHLRQFNL